MRAPRISPLSRCLAVCLAASLPLAPVTPAFAQAPAPAPSAVPPPAGPSAPTPVPAAAEPAAPAPGDAAADGKRPATSPVGGALRRIRRAQAAGANAPKPGGKPVTAPAAVPPPPPPPPAAIPVPAPTPVPSPSNPVSTGTGDLPGEREFNACKRLPAGRRIVKLNMKPESELSELIAWISAISCAQFIIPNPSMLTGKKVTIISPQLITPEEAYRLFLASIEPLGFTVEPSGKFLRVVETNKARFSSVPFLDGETRVPDTKAYVTRLVRLEYLDANDVNTAVLSRIKGEQGDIIVYQNTLIVTDQGTSINRIMDVLRQLDVPNAEGDKIWMVRVKNTSVTDMASRLAELFQVQQVGTGGRRGPGAPAPAPAAPPQPAKPASQLGPKRRDLASQMQITKLIPDERTNHLVIVANEMAYEWVRTLLQRLDVPAEGGGDGRINIYYCEHANCDELGATLGSILGVQVAGTQGARRTRAGQQAAPIAPTPTPTPGQPGQQNLIFEGDVRITFDRATNSLVVLSSLKDYQAIRKVIERLDAPRKQVFIEALIMEVNLDKSREVGVNYHGGMTPNIGGEQSLAIAGFGASKTLQPASLLGTAAVRDGLTGALFGPVINPTATRIFGTSVELPAFGVLLQALQTNNDVNVLSNPSLQIMNNDEGEITVGQNVPFPGGFLGGGLGALGGAAGATGGLGFPLGTSVQRQDVALKMKLVPSVNEHNIIKIDVDVEISDILSPNFNNLGPATSKRTAKTPIVTKDQQTVIIGGLMSTRTSEVQTKIPILGDIPILGFFFRNTKTQNVKSNIIIALTPYVINDPGDLKRVAEKKMRERREFIERYTAFQDIAKDKLNAEIDYRRKRGMLEEINQEARELDEEEESLRKIRERDLQEETAPIEPVRRGTQTRGAGEGALKPAQESEALRGLDLAPPAPAAANGG